MIPLRNLPYGCLFRMNGKGLIRRQYKSAIYHKVYDISRSETSVMRFAVFNGYWNIYTAIRQVMNYDSSLIVQPVEIRFWLANLKDKVELSELAFAKLFCYNDSVYRKLVYNEVAKIAFRSEMNWIPYLTPVKEEMKPHLIIQPMTVHFSKIDV
jgi:hypothetical protein